MNFTPEHIIASTVLFVFWYAEKRALPVTVVLACQLCSLLRHLQRRRFGRRSGVVLLPASFVL